jgi:hypothetical protein
MRLIHLYLVGYFALVIGAGLALWQAGVAQHVAPIWLFLCAVIALGLGLVLALTSTRPPTRT